MFSVPSLPTDSLYKFIFVTGIILSLSSIYLLITSTSDYEKNAWSTENAAFNVIMGYSELDDSAQYFKTIISNYDSLTKVVQQRGDSIINEIKNHPKTDTAFFKRKLDIVKDDNKHLKNHEKEFANAIHRSFLYTVKKSKYQNDTTTLNNQLRFLKNEMDFKDDILISLIFIGVIMTGCGGLFWYLNIQRPQDELLLLEIENAKKNVSNSIRRHYSPPQITRGRTGRR